jgi:hypothetical protein
MDSSSGGGIAILMTEQKPDGAQVGSGFKQMRSPAVPAMYPET